MKGETVVTGGAGFIGRHLVRRLLREGYDVYAIDNFHTGSWKNREEGVHYFLGNAGDVVRMMKRLEIRPSVIFHLGIPSSSPMYRDDRENIALAVRDFVRIMEYCMDVGAKLVLASTSSIYNGNPVPWREDMQILPTDFYTEVRYFMERLADVYNQLYGIEVVACRLFSVYGPFEEHKGRYANLVSQFIWSMMKNEPPVIFGDGTQTRDFIFVEDVVEGFIRAAEYKADRFEVFNLGYGKNYSLNQLVEMINEVLGKNIKPKYVENPIKNYVMHTLADMTKSREVLGFRPKVSLEEGIERCVEHYSKKFSS